MQQLDPFESLEPTIEEGAENAAGGEEPLADQQEAPSYRTSRASRTLSSIARALTPRPSIDYPSAYATEALEEESIPVPVNEAGGSAAAEDEAGGSQELREAMSRLRRRQPEPEKPTPPPKNFRWNLLRMGGRSADRIRTTPAMDRTESALPFLSELQSRTPGLWDLMRTRAARGHSVTADPRLEESAREEPEPVWPTAGPSSKSSKTPVRFGNVRWVSEQQLKVGSEETESRAMEHRTERL